MRVFGYLGLLAVVVILVVLAVNALRGVGGAAQATSGSSRAEQEINRDASEGEEIDVRGELRGGLRDALK
jgi:hypothetical protein